MRHETMNTGAPQGRSRLRAELLALGLIAALVVPVGVFAGKGGGAPSVTPWIALAGVSGESLAAAAQPSLGAKVRFESGYPTGTKNAWVSLTCYQDGTLVYGEGGKPTAEFGLGGASSLWLERGGGAACRAELGDLYWRGGRQYYTYLAHTTFDAEG